MTETNQERHAELLAIAQSLRYRGEQVEIVLAALRERSASVIETIKVLQDLDGLSLTEAKHIVHHSDAWQDLRSLHDRMHKDAIKVLGEEASVTEDNGKYRATIDLRSNRKLP